MGDASVLIRTIDRQELTAPHHSVFTEAGPIPTDSEHFAIEQTVFQHACDDMGEVMLNTQSSDV